MLHDVEGKSDTDIEAMMYYNVDYFRQRVPRIVLPPSQLSALPSCACCF